MVPKEWINVSLGDVITYKKGFAFDSSNFQSHGVQIIRISDTTSNSISLKNPIYVSKEVAAKLTAFILHEGDIVLSTVGSRPHLVDSMVGKAVRIPKETEGSLLNQNLVKLIPKKSVIINDYLYLMVKKSRFIYFISTLIRGNANQVSITLNELFKYKFPLPPLIEQKKITQILSTWDKAITTTEKLLANSEQQKKALMQQLLTGKKRFLGFSKEWSNGRLGELCDFKGGSAFKEVQQGKNSGDLPFIKVSDMNLKGNEIFIQNANNWITFEAANQMKAKSFPKWAIVFAKVGAALLLNRRRILQQETIIDNNMMAAIPKKSTDPNFLYQILLLIDFAKLVQEGAIPSINQSDLSAFKIHYPDIGEQQKIAIVLSTADREIENIKQKLDCLQQEKKALMQQLLTGKRRVQV
ncbi:TPA: restriction endonuclease subunit S [Legionella pneumophila]